MSEPIPEAIPTSQDPRSKRPTKRLALTPNGQQASQLNALFAHPEKEVQIPDRATAKPRGVAPPPEIVANVQGSSAGAGSGEFHVYKASRRREYERLRLMDEEVKRERENEEFEKRMEEKKHKDDAKTNKNKAKREKAKERKAKAKQAAKQNGAGKDDEDEDEGGGASEPEKTQSEGEGRTNGESVREDVKMAERNTPSANPDEIDIQVHDDD